LKEILDQYLVSVSSHIQTDESLNENSIFSWQVKANICVVCKEKNMEITSSAYQVLLSLY